MEQRPLIAYYRQSKEKSRTISIDEQRRDVVAWGQVHSATIAREIVEQGVSGSKSWRERGLGEAIEACKHGEAGGVIVAYQSRLSRENGLATAEVWDEFTTSGVRLIIVDKGIDTAAGDYEFQFSVNAAVAREEWKKVQDNFRRGREASVKAGVQPGRTPVGYKRTGPGERFRIDKPWAEKVRQAFELRRNGVAVAGIGRRFGWAESHTWHILQNESYLGHVWHGEFRHEDAHPAIVSRELFDAVQGVKTREYVPPTKRTEGRLLRGLVRCASCGASMGTVTQTRKDKHGKVTAEYPNYYCQGRTKGGCDAKAWVSAPKLEALVSEWFGDALRSTPRLVDVVQSEEELTEAQAELAKREKDLAGYVMTADASDPVLFRQGRDARTARRDEAKERVHELAARLGSIPDTRSRPIWTAWAESDIPDRRTILAGALREVVVSRGTGPLPERVSIVWADGTPAEVVTKHDRDVPTVAVA